MAPFSPGLVLAASGLCQLVPLTVVVLLVDAPVIPILAVSLLGLGLASVLVWLGGAQPTSRSEAHRLDNTDLQLFVKLPDNTIVTYCGPGHATVRDILSFVSEARPCTVQLSHNSNITLNSCGRVLTNKERALAAYGVQSGSHVEVLPRLLGGGGGKRPRKASKPSGRSIALLTNETGCRI